MRALVTGAQGFAGRYLVTRWLDRDPEIEIVGCGRSPGNSASFTHAVTTNDGIKPAPLPSDLKGVERNARYRYSPCDLFNAEGLRALLADTRPEVVVHLASGLRDDATEKLLQTNVLGTELLFLAAATIQPPPRMVVASSGSIYGAVADEKLPTREETPPAPFDMYSITKVAQGQVARMLGRRFQIPTMVVRIFNIIGPGQDERHFCGYLAAQIVAIEEGRKPPVLSVGPLTATRDFIDVRDVADGLIAAAMRGEDGATYNLASGCEVLMQRVFDEMVSLSNISGRFQVLPKPGRPADMPRNVASIERIVSCGFEPRVNLRQSLADVLLYYRNQDNGCH